MIMMVYCFYETTTTIFLRRERNFIGQPYRQSLWVENPAIWKQTNKSLRKERHSFSPFYSKSTCSEWWWCEGRTSSRCKHKYPASRSSEASQCSAQEHPGKILFWQSDIWLQQNIAQLEQIIKSIRIIILCFTKCFTKPPNPPSFVFVLFEVSFNSLELWWDLPFFLAKFRLVHSSPRKKGLEAESAFNSLSQPLWKSRVFYLLVLQTEIYQDTSTGMILGCYCCIKVPNQNVGTQKGHQDTVGTYFGPLYILHFHFFCICFEMAIFKV